MAAGPGRGKIDIITGLLQTQGDDCRYGNGRIAVGFAVADTPVMRRLDAGFADVVQGIHRLDDVLIGQSRSGYGRMVFAVYRKMLFIDSCRAELFRFSTAHIERIKGRDCLQPGYIDSIAG